MKPTHSTNEAKTDDDSEVMFMGECDCGGNVLAIESFDRVFSWCDECTPVQTIEVGLRGLGAAVSTSAFDAENSGSNPGAPSKCSPK